MNRLKLTLSTGILFVKHINSAIYAERVSILEKNIYSKTGAIIIEKNHVQTENNNNN